MNKIAVLGPKHTYSDEACFLFEKKTNQELERVYAKNIREVMILTKELGAGILPIENTLEGYLGQHLDLLLEFGFHIVSEIKLDISFSLVSHVALEDIKVIYVQYATKNQCLKFLNKYSDIEIIITDSNVLSYERYAKDKHSAAIIPEHLVDDEKVIIKNVTDELLNQTRFLIIKSNETKFSNIKNNKDLKAFLIVTPKSDRPGLLFDILKVFSKEAINLISIMSRPTKKEIGTYHFFIELEGKVEQLELLNNLFDHLKNTYDLKVMGVYQSL